MDKQQNPQNTPLSQEGLSYQSIQKLASRYTLYGTYLIDQRIKHDMKLMTQDLLHRHPDGTLESLYLGGAYGRGEGGVHKSKGLESPCGAYEIAVVYKYLKKSHIKPFETLLKQAQTRLNTRLKVPVLFYPILAHNQLSQLPFYRYWYELAHGHKAIWGNPHTIQAMPRFAHRALPVSEALPALLEAGVLLLQADQPNLKHAARMKAQMALGDAALILIQEYHYLFEQRIKQLKKLRAQLEWLPSALQLSYMYQEAIQAALYEQPQDEINTGNFDAFKDFFCETYLSLLGKYFDLERHNWGRHQRLLAHKNEGSNTLQTLIQNLRHFKGRALHPRWIMVELDFRRLYLLPYFLKQTLPPEKELKYLLPGLQDPTDFASCLQAYLVFCRPPDA